MNFCAQCGSNKLKRSIPDGDNRLRYICSDCERIHYENPNMVVGCLPIYKGRILLAKRSIEPRKGFWNLPCGFLENDETVQEGAIREVEEETGVRVTLKHLHTIYNLPHARQVYLIFLAEMSDINFHPTSESEAVDLFAPEDIPWKEMAFSSSAFAINKYLDAPHQRSTHFGTFYKGSD